MKDWFLKHLLRFPISISLNLVPLLGQSLVQLQPKIQWEEGRMLIPGQEMQHKLLLLNRGFQVAKDIPFPKGVPDYPESSGFLFQGEPWVFSHYEAQVPEGERVFDQLHCLRVGEWQLVASHEENASRRGFENIVPLKNGRFFGIRRARFQKGQEFECPFYLLALDEKGKLKTISEADGGVPAKAFTLPGLPMTSDLLRVGDFIVVMDPHPGWMWVYSAENGSFKRLVRVYDELDEKRLEKNDFSTVVLGAQPTEDGTVLLAIRAASAALTDDSACRLDLAFSDGVMVSEVEAKPGTEVKQPVEIRGQELMDSAWKHHPGVRWMLFEPATGRLKECDSPPAGARTRIASLAEFASFRWITAWDGKVEFRPLDVLITEGELALAKAKALKEKVGEPKKKVAGTNSLDHNRK